LLDSLNRANPDTILESDELVVKIEDTKKNAKMITDAQVKAKETEKGIEDDRAKPGEWLKGWCRDTSRNDTDVNKLECP